MDVYTKSPGLGSLQDLSRNGKYPYAVSKTGENYFFAGAFVFGLSGTMIEEAPKNADGFCS